MIPMVLRLKNDVPYPTFQNGTKRKKLFLWRVKTNFSSLERVINSKLS